MLQFLNNSTRTSTVSGHEVEYLLKSQESRTKTIIDGVDKRIDEELALHSQTFNHEIKKLQDVAREFQELFEKMVNSSKTSIKSKLKEFIDLFSKKVKQLDMFCDKIMHMVNVLIGATTKLIEEINFFSKGYTGEMKLKNKANGKVFDRIEKSLTGFQVKPSMFDFTPTHSLSQDQIFSMVCFVESCFKTK